ncbi:MAG: hypothetical protein CM15mP74_04630 [Halieaceae bacterium]|nr:MAG: hypothetical protein CM15mP74_04630 [Halieaceae bacterium]
MSTRGCGALETTLDINAEGLPTATEYLDLISPQYIADLISWGALVPAQRRVKAIVSLRVVCLAPWGSRMARVAISRSRWMRLVLRNTRITSCQSPRADSRRFLRRRNPFCHLILRGGPQPNYDMFSVDDACAMLRKADLPESIMIDASHANSRKQPDRQVAVAEDIASQVERGDRRITGLMMWRVLSRPVARTW